MSFDYVIIDYLCLIYKINNYDLIIKWPYIMRAARWVLCPHILNPWPFTSDPLFKHCSLTLMAKYDSTIPWYVHHIICGGGCWRNLKKMMSDMIHSHTNTMQDDIKAGFKMNEEYLEKKIWMRNRKWHNYTFNKGTKIVETLEICYNNTTPNFPMKLQGNGKRGFKFISNFKFHKYNLKKMERGV